MGPALIEVHHPHHFPHFLGRIANGQLPSGLFGFLAQAGDTADDRRAEIIGRSQVDDYAVKLRFIEQSEQQLQFVFDVGAAKTGRVSSRNDDERRPLALGPQNFVIPCVPKTRHERHPQWPVTKKAVSVKLQTDF